MSSSTSLKTSFKDSGYGYDGNKSKFPEWVEHIKSEMRTESKAAEFMDYLIGEHTPHPTLTGTFQYDPKYLLVKVPLPLLLEPVLPGDPPHTDAKIAKRKLRRNAALE